LPKFTAGRLLRPVAGLMVVVGCSSLPAGITGYLVAKDGGIWLIEPLRSLIPAEKHAAFLADLWSHITAYVVGLVGGVVLFLWVIFRRWRMAQRVPDQQNGPVAEVTDGR
jgi:hypothetical protein